MLVIKEAMLFLLMLLPSVLSGRGSSQDFNSPNMDKKCDTTIALNGDTAPGIYFSYSSGNYPQNANCTITVKAPTASQRIIVVIDKMDVACGGDRLLIYDGKKDSTSIINKQDSQQCGKSKYYVRTTNSNIAILQFLSNADGKVGTGFTLNIAINFPVTTCSRVYGFYQCENKYCISKAFDCDGRNWCGDNTQDRVCR